MPVSITPDFLVSTSNANQQFSPNITALADGRIVVTWESRDNGANYDIRGRILNADGTGAGNDFVISTSNANDQFSTSITALPDGRIAVTWASFDNGTDNNIRGRILNADGTGAGNDFVINTSNANGQLAPSITALADGRIAVTWQSFDNGTDYDIRGRILNADGTGAGNDFVISTTDANDQSAPSITALADGRIAVTWESDDNGTNYDIRGRILNADGAGAGNDFVISTSNTNGQSSPSITALADGRIAVTWESFDNGTDSDIRGRILNADGTGAGNDFVISTTNASTQSRPGITALADGRIAVTWESRDNGTNYDIRTTIIDPKLFTGTTASDVWTGGSADDAMYGYGGDDVFTGGGGNDYLNGGDNTDTLDGNAGRDVLDGGTGNDILFGKADDDRLIGGRGADTLNGGKGADRFIYRAVEDGGDSVVKFQSGDRFVFDNAGFAGLKEGKLNSKAFKSGTNNQAGDANDRFIFRTGDDTLWYDADGKGGQASVLMADLTNNYDLKVGDILIV
jgi:Ca2+-binding RTX toxin-like protein